MHPIRFSLILLVCVRFCCSSALAESALSIDGVQPGMTMSDVLRILGPPRQIRWQGNNPYFVYRPRNAATETAPTAGSVHFELDSDFGHVWFVNGRVAYVNGTTLYDGGVPLAHTGGKAANLTKCFGKAQEFFVFTVWWPREGVVVNDSRPHGILDRLALRNPTIPVHWYTSKSYDTGQTFRWAQQEPWLEGVYEAWRMDGVSLGMRRTRVHGILGLPLRRDMYSETYASGIVVHYTRGGFVRRLEGGSTVRHDVSLGYHNLSQGPWHIGRPIEYLDELQHAHGNPVTTGVASLTPQVRFTLEKGVAKRFEFVGDAAVFDALDAAGY